MSYLFNPKCCRKMFLNRIILFLIFSTLICITTSCTKEKIVDRYRSNRYYYSEDKRKILYDQIPSTSLLNIFMHSYKEVPTDLRTFKVLGPDFGKDNKHIFYTYKKLENVDHASFYWDSINQLPKDKKHVYLAQTDTNRLTIIKYADPKTYERVDLMLDCNNWYKDKRYYYFNHKKTPANRQSMRFDSPLLPFDYRFVFGIYKNTLQPIPYKGVIKVANTHLIYDNIRIYYSAHCDSSTVVLDYKNISTLKFYDNDLTVFRLDSMILINGFPIQDNNIDTETFEIIKYNYSKDKNKIYYKTFPIENSNPETFEVLSEKYAKDKNQVYKRGAILKKYSPDNFVADQWGRYPPDFNYGKKPED